MRKLKFTIQRSDLLREGKPRVTLVNSKESNAYAVFTNVSNRPEAWSPIVRYVKDLHSNGREDIVVNITEIKLTNRLPA